MKMATRTEKRIPPTTDQKCAQHRATISQCGCPNHRHGASYLHNHVILCKHRYHLIKKAEGIFEELETTTCHPQSKHPFCLCSEFFARGGQGCKHVQLMRKMSAMFRAARN
jgi:hypothetical protein